MATVVLSPYNVANYREGGGHLWVYMQYAQGLLRSGCEVYWLERFRPGADPERDRAHLEAYLDRMGRYGLGGKVLLYSAGEASGGPPREWIGVPEAEAEAVLRRADLLLNFHYAMDAELLARFRRTALVDIDPGLLQFWMGTGQLAVPPHDVYFTIGETVGSPSATFPDCGLRWVHIRPPACLDLWPRVYDPGCAAFTTVAGWWSGKWVRELVNGRETLYENTKRASFLEFLDLPIRTSQELELALCLADDDVEDRRALERRGWRVRHAREVAGTPEMYRAYIQASRGEFSCAKPSCMKLQNAWISDRTVCYLASGKPAVVQDTGPSAFLPNGEGLFRFSTIGEAVEALAAVNAAYERHCRAARDLAAAFFDARRISEIILNATLS